LITNVVSTNSWGHTTHIYGAEYEDNVFGSNVFQNDVPCAVCHTTHTSSVLVIPGRNHLEQTTHVRKALLMYGGHGKEPQPARTG
jgi:hypothetical protein